MSESYKVAIPGYKTTDDKAYVVQLDDGAWYWFRAVRPKAIHGPFDLKRDALADINTHRIIDRRLKRKKAETNV